MSVRNLDRLFAPRRIAVVGAGGDVASVGHVVLSNLVSGSFDGVVYPINPGREAVHGIQAYASVEDTPAPADLAVVCTHGKAVPDVVRACGRAGVPALAVLSAGFRETGPEGASLEEEVAAAAREVDGLRILGPNCVGLVVPRHGLNASFGAEMPPDGPVAFISQSGALATSMIGWAKAGGVGFSHVISLGNMVDVDVGDLIDYLAQDSRTRSIVLYVEAVSEARKFMSAARAYTLGKPVVAYKAGRFAASAGAASSHTGALAGEDDVYDAAFARAGIVRVDRLEDVFASAELLASQRPTRRGRLAIVTNAGGPGVMAADALLARRGELAQPGEATLDAMRGLLPPAASVRNPVDVLGDAGPERFEGVVAALLGDPDTDAVLVLLSPQAMTDPAAVADAVVRARGRSRKPLLTAWLGGESVAAGAEVLSRAGVPTYDYPEQAVDAFMVLVEYGRRRSTLYETPQEVPVTFSLDRDKVRPLMSTVLAGDGETLSEAAAKTLLQAYEIPVTEPRPASTAADAVAAADDLGYPVVLKVRSPDISHKTDVGGVFTGLETADAVAAGYDRLLASVAERAPDARLSGVTVQPMATTPGQELLLGAHRDPTFGAVIAVGAGGIATEVLADRALGLPPLNERLARSMLESLRIWPLLAGHRGRPGVDVDRLVESVIRFSYLVADYPELLDLEVNPLLVTADGSVALDARATVDQSAVGSPPPRYSHLAIRPYPHELSAEVTTAGGLRATLRPIKPEDEPLWHEMLDACSLESIRMRFRGLVKHTHEMAARYCFVDYDRELAIVAEVEHEGRKRLAGVGRLAADPDHRRAEYAVLVADPWQGRGLSDSLTDRCLELARPWGVETVYAETTSDNRRMKTVMQAHGFAVRSQLEDGLVVGEQTVVGAE